eukprot:TRINITY_DN34598_c0_g1_i1.p1 TRINITY_DN34598_c0_g1~~TRINITY_DN34598_c0_g1_i1.p1  ORF type:complete len:1000 (-),score=220.56 TRINITY_DN34598_c0_g1_i1:94-3093(-)
MDLFGDSDDDLPGVPKAALQPRGLPEVSGLGHPVAAGGFRLDAHHLGVAGASENRGGNNSILAKNHDVTSGVIGSACEAPSLKKEDLGNDVGCLSATFGVGYGAGASDTFLASGNGTRVGGPCGGDGNGAAVVAAAALAWNGVAAKREPAGEEAGNRGSNAIAKKEEKEEKFETKEEDEGVPATAEELAIPDLRPHHVVRQSRSATAGEQLLATNAVLELRRVGGSAPGTAAAVGSDARRTEVVARVRGSGPRSSYIVRVPSDVVAAALAASCTCMDFSKRGGICKHAAAVLLALVPGSGYDAPGKAPPLPASAVAAAAEGRRIFAAPKEEPVAKRSPSPPQTTAAGSVSLRAAEDAAPMIVASPPLPAPLDSPSSPLSPQGAPPTPPMALDDVEAAAATAGVSVAPTAAATTKVDLPRCGSELPALSAAPAPKRRRLPASFTSAASDIGSVSSSKRVGPTPGFGRGRNGSLGAEGLVDGLSLTQGGCGDAYASVVANVPVVDSVGNGNLDAGDDASGAVVTSGRGGGRGRRGRGRGGGRTKRGFAEDGPPKPLTAYHFFMRGSGIEGRGMGVGDAAAQWKELSPEERRPYEQLAAEDRQRYEEERQAHVDAIAAGRAVGGTRWQEQGHEAAGAAPMSPRSRLLASAGMEERVMTGRPFQLAAGGSLFDDDCDQGNRPVRQRPRQQVDVVAVATPVPAPGADDFYMAPTAASCSSANVTERSAFAPRVHCDAAYASAFASGTAVSSEGVTTSTAAATASSRTGKVGMGLVSRLDFLMFDSQEEGSAGRRQTPIPNGTPTPPKEPSPQWPAPASVTHHPLHASATLPTPFSASLDPPTSQPPPALAAWQTAAVGPHPPSLVPAEPHSSLPTISSYTRLAPAISSAPSSLPDGFEASLLPQPAAQPPQAIPAVGPQPSFQTAPVASLVMPPPPSLAAAVSAAVASVTRGGDDIAQSTEVTPPSATVASSSASAPRPCAEAEPLSQSQRPAVSFFDMLNDLD